MPAPRNSNSKTQNVSSIEVRLQSALDKLNELRAIAQGTSNKIEEEVKNANGGFISQERLTQWQNFIVGIKEYTNKFVENVSSLATELNNSSSRPEISQNWQKFNNDISSLANGLKNIQSLAAGTSQLIQKEQKKTDAALDKLQAQTVTTPSPIQRLKEAGDKLKEKPTDADVIKKQQEIMQQHRQANRKVNTNDRVTTLNNAFKRMEGIEHFLKDLSKEASQNADGKCRLNALELNELTYVINSTEQQLDKLYPNPKEQAKYKSEFVTYRDQVAQLNKPLVQPDRDQRSDVQSAPPKYRPK